MLGSFLLLGLLLGVKHALEADHVAALAALATRSRSVGDSVKLAGLWGLGHGAVVVSVGGLILLLGITLPAVLVRGLEALVGLMLIALGASVLVGLRRRHVHFHAHQHDGGVRHIHAHAHESGEAHEPAHHRHQHPRAMPSRALLVGGMHGLAGSAALVLLPLGAAASAPRVLASLATFALGSVLGMVALSVTIALPLGASARHLGAFARGLEAAVGMVTVALGCSITVAALAGG